MKQSANKKNFWIRPSLQWNISHEIDHSKCVYSFRDTITEFTDLFCVFITLIRQSSFIFVNFPTWNLQQELFLSNLRVFENKKWTLFSNCWLFEVRYQSLQLVSCYPGQCRQKNKVERKGAFICNTTHIAVAFACCNFLLFLA